MTAYAQRLERVRRLGVSDAAARELDGDARRAVGELWAGRAQGELSTASIFSGLHRDCLNFGVNASITRLTERAVDDERFHGALSSFMAEHYLGAAVPSPVPSADALRFESCSAEVAPALRFVLHCALNETVAVAYLRQCHREACSVLVRAAVRELLHDEINHSRVGWAYVASAAGRPDVRDSLRRELRALFALVLDAWCKPMSSSLYPIGHGALSEAGTREVAEEALRSVVLPGLARFGIEPT
jgi:hypothetical protein